MFLSKVKSKSGFTLIELSIVIAIAAIISVVIYLGVLPAKRISQTNNAVRVQDAKAIEKAIKAVLLDSTILPTAITDITSDTYYSLVASGASDSGQYTCDQLSQDINRLDIASTLESYIGTLPVDPEISSGDDSGYYLIRRGDLFDIGYCNWYVAPVIAGGGGSSLDSFVILETDDYDFDAGTTTTVERLEYDADSYVALTYTSGNNGLVDTTQAEDVVVLGDYAYVADSSNGLRVINVSTPSSPSIVGTYDGGDAGVQEVAIYGDHVYICSNYIVGGLQAIDVSTKTNPIIAKNMSLGSTGTCTDLQVEGTKLYVSVGVSCGEYCVEGYLNIYDLSSTPADPSLLGISANFSLWPEKIYIDGDYAYISTAAADFAGLTWLDVSNPASPSYVDSRDTSGNEASGIAVKGEYVYVGADTDVQVITTTTPALMATYVGSGVNLDFHIYGDILYTATKNDLKVHALNISDPLNIIEDTYYISTYPYAVYYKDNYLYVADYASGLRTLGVPTYASSGTFTSQILDTVSNATFDIMSWTSSEPSGTSITIKARTSNDSGMSGATDWGSCSAVTSGGDISENSCVTDEHRYVQYQTTFTTSDTGVSSRIKDLTINYSADSAETYCGDSICSSAETCSSCGGDCTDCPNAPTVSDAGRTPVDTAGSQAYNVRLNWTAWTDLDGDTVEYYSIVYNGNDCTGSVKHTQDWSTTNYYDTNLVYDATYSWQTRARSQNRSDETAYNTCYSFVVESDPGGGTCPYLYSWDGSKWVFQSDTTAIGPLGFKIGRNPVAIKPRPLDKYVFESIYPVNGQIELRIASDLDEINYYDSQKLYYYDVPEHMHVGVEQPALDSPYAAPYTDHIFASDSIKPITAFRLDTNEDVLNLISERDKNKLILNEDPDDFETKFIELDFGDISKYRQKKLIVVANSAFPTTKEGLQKGKPGVSSVLYVLDKNNEWQAVSYEIVKPATPRPFERRMVIDISDIFLSDNTKIRMSYLYKTYIDQISFDGLTDNYLPEPQEVELVNANLMAYNTFHPVDKDGGEPDYYYTMPLDIEGYNGAYTKLGDITELLLNDDDKFVVMAKGDEVIMKYNEPEEALTEGYKRVYILDTIGYHKANKRSHVDMTVDPMPFKDMDNFPYSIEYPYSQNLDYQEYLDTYNTRICVEEFNFCYDANTKDTIKRQSSSN